MYYPEHINDDGTWLYNALQKGKATRLPENAAGKPEGTPSNQCTFTALTDPGKTAVENIAAEQRPPKLFMSEL